MSWSTYRSAEDFSRSWRTVLQEDESVHCLAWAAMARACGAAEGPPPFRFFSHDGDAHPRAYAILIIRKKELILSDMSVYQAAELLPFLDKQALDIEEVEGPVEAVHALTECWSRPSHRSHSVKMRQALHEIRNVQSPHLDGGKLCLATRDHEKTVQDYLRGFVSDCFPTEHWSDEQLSTHTERLLNEKKGFLWKDSKGKIVSMAAIVRESPNTASISLVYTPLENRRQGHAARVVAALSQTQLDAGKVACNLHTDLANPTSNSVYHRIGYRVIRHLVRVQLMQG